MSQTANNSSSSHHSVIPGLLRQRRQWVCWRYEKRNGKPTKVPYIAGTERRASTTDPSTWVPFDVAWQHRQRYDGVGFALADDDELTGVDLDHCIDEHGEIADWAMDIVACLDSYTEYTPSGAGLRVFCRGTLPPGGRKRGPVEMYEQGRYLTVTANHVPDTCDTIEERTEQLAIVHAEYFPPELEPKQQRVVSIRTLEHDDQELIRRAEGAANGHKFAALWGGDKSEYGGDDSSADLALCSLLAFWTGGDVTRMDRLFRQSGLMRAKWDERRGASTYGERTIARAAATTHQFYGSQPTTKVRRMFPAKGTSDATPSLPDVLATFRRWLHLDDPAPACIVLGAVAANYASGDPLWLMLIGPASGGKTELLNAISRLPHVYLSATVTEAALLSGTPKRDKDKGAKGGLLRVIGEFGILLCKDFTSILSMHRDPRAAMLAALREIYDGSWTRHVGVDGGRTLAWQGKLGLIAGCTTAIDTHHQVTAAMGERFLYCRLLEISPREQGLRALANTGREAEMRRELADAVAGLFAGLDLGQPLAPLNENEASRLVDLASLAARARSGVERDSRTHEIELIMDSEAPARLVQALRRLYGGLRVIGVDRPRAWEYTVRAGLDCLPKLRRGGFDVLASSDEWWSTTEVAKRLSYPSNTTRRALEDLAAHQIVERDPGGSGRADAWRLTTWARKRYEGALTVPEMSVDIRNTRNVESLLY